MLAALLAAVALGLPAAPQQTCQPTRADALGPFYVPNAPRRSSVGSGHVLTGVVRSLRDCEPIAGARIEFWLVGSNGRYDAAHRAIVISSRAGAYRFTSNVPRAYESRPPHIHLRVTAPNHRTLVTQFYPRRGQTRGTFALVLVARGFEPAGGNLRFPPTSPPSLAECCS